MMTETAPEPEPAETDLPDKPAIEEIPEEEGDEPSVPGEEEVPEEDFHTPEEADADEEVDNKESEAYPD